MHKLLRNNISECAEIKSNNVVKPSKRSDNKIVRKWKKMGENNMTIEQLMNEYQVDRQAIEQVLEEGFNLNEIEEMLIESEL